MNPRQAAIVAATSGYSMPASSFHRPFCQCNETMAFTMTPITAAPPSGVSSPRTRRAPPVDLGGPGDGGVDTAGAVAEALEEGAGPVEPVAIEPAEELLGTVTDEQKPQNDAEKEQPDTHGADRLPIGLRRHTSFSHRNENTF